MRSNIYARAYVDLLDDPKLLDAAEEGAQHLAWLPWLIVYAKKHDPEDRGRLLAGAGRPATPRAIARGIPCASAEQIEGCMRELADIGILAEGEDGALHFVNWDVRSGGAPGRSAPYPSQTPEAKAEQKRRERERARQERERQAAAGGGDPPPPRGGGQPTPPPAVASDRPGVANPVASVASDMELATAGVATGVASDGRQASEMSLGVTGKGEESRVETAAAAAGARAHEDAGDVASDPDAPAELAGDGPPDVRPVTRVPVNKALARHPGVGAWVAEDDATRRPLVKRLAARVQGEGGSREDVFAWVGELAMLVDGARGRLTALEVQTGLSDFLNTKEPNGAGGFRRPPLVPKVFRSFFRGAANEEPVDSDRGRQRPAASGRQRAPVADPPARKLKSA